MINRVVLVGRLTRDLELKYTTNGIANVRFGLAVNRTYSGQNGERQADFINCVAWRKQAENMSKFLKKGSLIGVEGRIETGSYQAQDGSTRYTTDIVCENIQFLEPKKNPIPGEQNQGNYQYNNQTSTVENPFDKNFATPPQDFGYNPNNSMFGGSNNGPDFSSNININDDDLPF